MRFPFTAIKPGEKKKICDWAAEVLSLLIIAGLKVQNEYAFKSLSLYLSYCGKKIFFSHSCTMHPTPILLMLKG